MRILHVIDTLDPASGGPQTVVLRLAAAQAALGHEVGIVSHACGDAEARIAAAAAQVPGVEAVGRHRVPRGGRVERLLAPGARAACLDLFAGADMVHLHGVWEPIIRVAAAAARARAVPYCLCPHGMLDPWSLGQKRLKKAVALRLAYRRVLDGAAFLHALNADEVERLAPLRLAAPVVVVPNGVFVEEVEPLPAPGSFARRCPAVAGHPYVLFLGRLHFKKGLDVLAEAFAGVAAALPDVHLVVAGPDGGARRAFEGAVVEAGLGGRVHLVGPLYGADKLAALADAACFCLPSRQEGFSVAITEALACGVPVVVSHQCRFPDVAAHGAGEVVALSAPSVRGALLRVLSDPALAARMGARGRALVRARYVWPAIAPLTLAAYEAARRGAMARPGASPGTKRGSRSWPRPFLLSRPLR